MEAQAEYVSRRARWSFPSPTVDEELVEPLLRPPPRCNRIRGVLLLPTPRAAIRVWRLAPVARARRGRAGRAH